MIVISITKITNNGEETKVFINFALIKTRD